MKIQRKSVLSKYSMSVEENKLIVKGEGISSKKDMQSYMNDFMQVINSMDTSNLTLIIDNKYFNMSFPDAKLFYDKISEVYINTNFKEKYIIMPESEIANIQIKKNGDKIFDTIKVISDLESAGNLG
ncbi:hypothetical protein KYD98_08995 [Clostridium sp. YB-6]|uniref:DUF4325 domain-containing protein n=1 Tax=Clostridium weizhouense TaxID=2859781 RepID=A0ABS7ANI7_9CLOT|nr:hypothetical protein [Clostridium weizhouense]